MNAIKAKGMALALFGLCGAGFFFYATYVFATDPHWYTGEEYPMVAVAAFAVIGLIAVRKGLMQFKTGVDYRVLDKERRAQRKRR